jgi:excisionase family DNA binding protein
MPLNMGKILRKPESENISELRLLSINKASKILGIRYETVRTLVRTGKIKGVTLANNRIKIPYKNLLEFLNSEAKNQQPDNGIISLEETQKKIDALIKEYSG